MLDAVALAALALLAAALRAAGRRFHWWVLPGALALHWFLWQGHGRAAAYLVACAAFLTAVGAAAWQSARPAPAGAGAPWLPQPAPCGPAQAPVEAPRTAPPAARAAAAGPPPEPGEARPAAVDADLLAALATHASPRQRAELWPQLRAPGEHVTAPGGPAAVHAEAARRPWGPAVVPGLLLEWEPVAAPPEATVLVLRCTGAGLPDGRPAALVLVPTSLPGVKRLGEAGERCAGRGVFVPLHLVLGADREDVALPARP